ncbi:putative reverse transcriptase domain-containing protein [Tanacetum coccineum]
MMRATTSPIPLPSSFLFSPIRPPHTRAAIAQMRAAAPPTYHSLLLAGTPPLLPIPLPAPSNSRRADISEADMPFRKRLLLTAPTPRMEVGETSAAGAARRPCHRGGQLEGQLPGTGSQERERGFLLTASGCPRGSSEAHNKALEARIATMETQLHRMEWQRQDVGDYAIRHIMRTQALKDALTLWRILKMAPTKRTTRTSPATTTTTTTAVTDAQLKALIAQGVSDALAEIETNRTNRNSDDSHNSGTGSRRTEQAARECTYGDFLKCQPLNFKGTEGVVGLTQWLKKMKSVFHISNCTVACQIKFATCTLQGIALAWWNSHVKTVTHDVAYAMPWKTLKKMMTDKYCPRGEVKKLEVEMWNLKVKGTDVVGYNQRFQDLALMCDRMFPEESDMIEKYIGGLPDMIHGSVMATKPKTMQDAIEFATELMDKKISTLAECQAKNKRKFEDTSRNNQNQQQPFKRHNVARAYTARPGDKKPYRGSKCNTPKNACRSGSMSGGVTS